MAFAYATTPGYHEASSAPVTAAPLSISCRFQIANGTVGGMYVQLFNSASPTLNYFRLISNDARKVQASAKDADFTGTATHGTNLSNNTWSQAGAIFESSASRYSVFNGVLSSQNTTTVTPAGINRVRIGGGSEQTNNVAEVGIWNVVLTADEWAALAAGYSPRAVRRVGLVFYAPLVRDVIDLYGLSLSASGSPTVLEHPRVIYPHRRKTFSVATAGSSSPSGSPSSSASATPSASPSSTPSASLSASPSASPSASASGTPSASPSASASASPSSSPSESPSGTPSASVSSSPSTSPSNSPSPSASPSGSPSASASATPSESASSTPSTSPSGTPSASASASPSASASASPSASPSPSASVSASPSTSPSGEEATITIEGNVFTQEVPGVNVDANRLLSFQMTNADDIVLTFEETEVT